MLLDKGPLPNPGGSTGHASNFIFPVDHSREMTALTADSMRQYEELGVRIECGGIEVARTEERMQELRRRMVSAASWGVGGVSLVTPAEIKELVPYIDESVIIGGFYTPESVSVVDSLRAGTLMRERAQESGALTVSANTEVLGIDVEHGRVRRVRTTRGDVEAEIVVIACGVWSPRLARMAGASIPLTPAVHQMIDIGPVPRFAGAKSAIEFPIVRDMDTNMYERQDGSGLEVGSYAHRPILHDPDEIPSVEEAALSPTEFPFTAGRLRRADGARARADAGDRGRRVGGHQVRDQRPALAHPGRHAGARRDARGGAGSGPRPRSGSRRAPAWAARWPSGWSRASPRSSCRRPTSPASTSARRASRT